VCGDDKPRRELMIFCNDLGDKAMTRPRSAGSYW
jgi:hypothetical protein